MNDLKFYKLYKKWYYRVFYKEEHNINYQHDFDIYDVVKINNNLSHDKGYSGQYGIVVDLLPYVIAYNSINKRYWVCGFKNDEFIKINKPMEDMGELYEQMKSYLLKNKFNISTAAFKETWNKYKDGLNFNKIIGCLDIGRIEGNIIYVNF